MLEDGCGGEVDCGQCSCPPGEIGTAITLASATDTWVMDAEAHEGRLAVLLGEGRPAGNTAYARFGLANLNGLEAGLDIRALHGSSLRVAGGGAVAVSDVGFAYTYNLRNHTFGGSTCVAEVVDFTGAGTGATINLRGLASGGCSASEITWVGSHYTALDSVIGSSSTLHAVDYEADLRPGAIPGSGREVSGSFVNSGRALAWDGEHLYAAYSSFVGRDEEGRSNTEVFAKRVDGGEAVQISSRPGVSRWPELVPGPAGPALVWDDFTPEGHEKVFTVLDIDGVPRFRPVVLSTDARGGSSIRRGTAGYGLVWVDFGNRMIFVEVGDDGDELAPAQVVETDVQGASLVFDLGAYFALWTDDLGVHATRICGS